MTTPTKPDRRHQNPGRPRKPKGPREQFCVRLSDEERRTIDAAATAAGLSIPEYVRRWAVGGAALHADVVRLLAATEPRADCLVAALCLCVRRSISRITGP